MLNKKISAVICVIYIILIGFYIHSINSGETTRFKKFSRENLVFYCCDEGSNCGYQEDDIENKLLSQFSEIIPEVNGVFNVQYFDEFRCNMKEIKNLSDISTWSRVRIMKINFLCVILKFKIFIFPRRMARFIRKIKYWKNIVLNIQKMSRN